MKLFIIMTLCCLTFVGMSFTFREIRKLNIYEIQETHRFHTKDGINFELPYKIIYTPDIGNMVLTRKQKQRIERIISPTIQADLIQSFVHLEASKIRTSLLDLSYKKNISLADERTIFSLNPKKKSFSTNIYAIEVAIDTIEFGVLLFEAKYEDILAHKKRVEVGALQRKYTIENEIAQLEMERMLMKQKAEAAMMKEKYQILVETALMKQIKDSIIKRVQGARDTMTDEEWKIHVKKQQLFNLKVQENIAKQIVGETKFPTSYISGSKK